MPPTNIDSSRQKSLYDWGFVMTIIPTISIILRFWARTVTTEKRKLWWDDALALGSWACCMFVCAILFRSVHLGLGLHTQDISPASNITAIYELLYASQIVFDVGITLAKFSVLCFYLRVFPVRSRRFKIAFWSTFAGTAAFIVFRLAAQLSICRPPEKYWKPDVPGRCDSSTAIFALLLTGLAFDVLLDLLILVIPMPILTGLQVRKGTKIMLCLAFFCGYLAWITSIGRLGTFVALRAIRTNDFSYAQIPEHIWAGAELATSASSICIPSYIPLVRRASQHGWRALFSTRSADSLRSDERFLHHRDVENRVAGRWQDSVPGSSVCEKEGKGCVGLGLGAGEGKYVVEVRGGQGVKSDSGSDVREPGPVGVSVRRDVSVVSKIGCGRA